MRKADFFSLGKKPQLFSHEVRPSLCDGRFAARASLRSARKNRYLFVGEGAEKMVQFFHISEMGLRKIPAINFLTFLESIPLL